jgi:hypothetical protein
MRNSIRFFALVAGLALAGCSTYQKRWEVARDAVHSGDPFAGAYIGRWESGRQPGTGGNFWCILSPSGRDSYRAEFKATWHGVFRSEHFAELGLVDGVRGERAKEAAFHGEATLDTWIGDGKYVCDGIFRREGFSAKYDAVYDTGTFVLKRAGTPVCADAGAKKR